MLRTQRTTLLCLAGLAVLSLLMFGDILFFSAGRVLSQPGSDLSDAEADGKLFIFNALRKGHVVGWNPHQFSGMPFLGTDGAIMYPLNILYAALPIEKAINLHIALHTWLLGAGMFFWTRFRKLHPLACFVGGTLLMFSGPFFLHVFAGHLSNLAAMAWAPFLFLASDLIGDRRVHAGVVFGSCALALQILAGQPQYVYYTCIAVLIYSVMRLVKTERRLEFLAGHAVMVFAAVALAAVQLLPSWDYNRDTIRGAGGVSIEFAGMFSFPPENLITLLAPGFFGDMTSSVYWGRCYLWEMSLFVGVTGFLFALYGLIAGRPDTRRYSSAMIGVLFLLALGSHTPLFSLLYHFVPGFNSLRGNSKFAFQAMLFVGMLATIGLDEIINSTRISRRFVLAVLSTAIVLLLSGIAIQISSHAGFSGMWSKVGEIILATGESYLPPTVYQDAGFVRTSGGFAAQGLYWSAAAMFLAGLFLLVPIQARWRAGALSMLAVAEVFLFAKSSRPSFEMKAYRDASGVSAINEFLHQQPGDFRVLQLVEPNSGLFTGAQNIWGYGSQPLRRYIELMAYTQGENPDTATQYLQFRNIHRLYSMLRCRFALLPAEKGIRIIETKDAMQRVQLVGDYRVESGREAIFKAMTAPDFDPHKTVILESVPDPTPVKIASPGSAKVTRSSADDLEIEAEVATASILLITDVYTKDWRAIPLPGTSQSEYHVMPANYILRAIPLSAGHHRLRLEYVPRSFAIGRWVSSFAWAAWIGLLATQLSWRRQTEPMQQTP